MHTWCWVNQFIPKIISNLADSMITKEDGKMTPLISIFKLRQTRLLLSKDSGDCTSIFFLKIKQGNLFWATKLCEIKEWEAPESNKIIAGMLLTGNIPMKTSGSSWASSAERWSACPLMVCWTGYGPYGWLVAWMEHLSCRSWDTVWHNVRFVYNWNMNCCTDILHATGWSQHSWLE